MNNKVIVVCCGRQGMAVVCCPLIPYMHYSFSCANKSDPIYVPIAKVSMAALLELICVALQAFIPNHRFPSGHCLWFGIYYFCIKSFTWFIAPMCMQSDPFGVPRLENLFGVMLTLCNATDVLSL